MLTDGFVDLRASARPGTQNDDSVWPSFTDIMTVVVMIFLMALVVILINNVDLVRELRTTIAAKSTADAEKDTLNQRVARMERMLAELQLVLSQTRQERDFSEEELAARNRRVTALLADIAALRALRDRLIGDNERLAAERARLQGRSEELETERSRLAASSSALREERDALAEEKIVIIGRLDALEGERNRLGRENEALENDRDELDRRKQTLEEMLENLQRQMLSLQRSNQDLRGDKAQLESDRSALEGERDSVASRLAQLQKVFVLLQADQTSLEERFEESLTKLASLRGTYTDLKQRYDELVKPARSPDGKHVVEIRFYRAGAGELVYELRDPSKQADFVRLDKPTLLARLTELRDDNPGNLYTRVILPETSGLSYNEAWSFTNEILNRFDYYYEQ